MNAISFALATRWYPVATKRVGSLVDPVLPGTKVAPDGEDPAMSGEGNSASTWTSVLTDVPTVLEAGFVLTLR